MSGPLSKYGFILGITRYLQSKTSRRLPDLKKLWVDAYFNWLKVRRKAQDMIKREIHLRNTEFDSTTGSLHDLCPACFYRKTEDQNPYYFSVDGNFQHKRYRCVASAQVLNDWGLTFLPPEHNAETPSSVLIDIPTGRDAIGTDPATRRGCPNMSAASTSHKPNSMARLDETGLMGAVCRHGNPLRYLNMYRGEDAASTARLIKGVMSEVPSESHFFIQYDIACHFERSFHKFDARLASQVTFSLNAFHQYCHKLSCQLRWGPRNIPGIGLSDGEGGERDWLEKRPYVASGRVSSAEHRLAVLDHKNIHGALIRKIRTGSFLAKRRQSAEIVKRMSEGILRALFEVFCGPTADVEGASQFERFLKQQRASQRQYFEGENADRGIVEYQYHELYSALKQEAELASPAIYKGDGGFNSSYQEKRDCLALQVDDLLRRHGFKDRTQWSMSSPLWQSYFTSDVYQQLDVVKLQLQRLYAERMIERRNIKTRVSGHREANLLLKALRRRWPKLSKLVNRFNELRDTLPPNLRPSPIDEMTYSIKNLEETYSEPLWRYEKNRAEALQRPLLWGMSPDLLRAIDAMQKKERAIEELRMNSLEIERAIQWAADSLCAYIKEPCLLNLPEVTTFLQDTIEMSEELIHYHMVPPHTATVSQLASKSLYVSFLYTACSYLIQVF